MELTVKEFEHFYRCLYRPLGMYVLRYTENIDDAEDIVQEAFANVWDKVSSGEVISDFKSYMYRVVRNRALSFLQSSPYELIILMKLRKSRYILLNEMLAFGQLLINYRLKDVKYFCWLNGMDLLMLR